ncbi:MAG: transposase, partial [Actinomycetota bacterium]|nr:transposase [Actinomycetota bacterium]
LEDKILQRAVVEVLNAVYEEDFLGFSYGLRGNTHVRFGGAGRGNGPSERTTPRPDPIPTNRPGETIYLEADHRRHAHIELVIRGLKEGAGWAHMPLGLFGVNAAWLAIGAIAHNLARWTGRLGAISTSVITTPTRRRRYFAIPGHLTRSARRTTLHLADSWPWRQAFIDALERLRGLEQQALQVGPVNDHRGSAESLVQPLLVKLGQESPRGSPDRCHPTLVKNWRCAGARQEWLLVGWCHVPPWHPKS